PPRSTRQNRGLQSASRYPPGYPRRCKTGDISSYPVALHGPCIAKNPCKSIASRPREEAKPPANRHLSGAEVPTGLPTVRALGRANAPLEIEDAGLAPTLSPQARGEAALVTASFCRERPQTRDKRRPVVPKRVS